MQNRPSSPKHRHDGTSPLPLGLDWSPPPKLWAGRETMWPHDHRTGWSYCVTIPSWVVLPKSKHTDPIVFYRVLVGIQSPQGATITRAILRRFNDFLKFLAALKKAFPRKNLPPAPPKGLVRLKTRDFLEERRHSLEDWMERLLSDIDISRSVAVASFLELGAAARSSFQDENQSSLESNPFFDSTASSLQVHPNLSLSKEAGSLSLMSECGSDTAYETSEIGTPSLGRDDNSEAGSGDFSMDEDLTGPIDRLMKYGMSNIDEGLFVGQAILEQLEHYPRHRAKSRGVSKAVENKLRNGSLSSASYHSGNMVLLPDAEHGKVILHARNNSAESIGTDRSTQRGSEASTSALVNCLDEPVHFGKGIEVPGSLDLGQGMDGQCHCDIHLLLPVDQRQKLNGVLLTMQRRLVTAKTDMEDLISRLNQEIAVKDYLSTKVRDLEVELQTTNQKGKEHLEQAVLLERERITQMQWDMEELRRRSIEMELRLNCQQDQNFGVGSIKISGSAEKDDTLQELNAIRSEFEDLLKRHQELEVKSKADIKVLVKEVKLLRSAQSELKQELNQLLQEKSEIQGLLQQEKLINEQRGTIWRKWLGECKALLNELLDCKILLKRNGDSQVMDFTSSSDALNLLASSDGEIDVILNKVQHLRQDLSDSVGNGVNIDELDEDLKRMLTDMVMGNVELRKQLHSLIRHAVKDLASGYNVCGASSNEDGR